MQDSQVVIAGAGVVGLTLGVRLAEQGWQVSVCDPVGPLGNASAVAAGMLAPAMEAALDPPSAGYFDLLESAREAWPALAARLGLPLHCSGAAALGQTGYIETLGSRLADLGARWRYLSAPEVAGLGSGAPGGLYCPDDWRIDVILALATLRSAAAAEGVRLIPQALTAFEPGRATLASGAQLACDRLILASGHSPGLRPLAPELGWLSPIKGQILHLPSAPAPPCVVRGEEVYICPAARGVLVGATMEAGRSDRRVEPETLEVLRRGAADLLPALGRGPAEGRAGVRAATPDALPLVGPSLAPGVWMATGMRRNGWLLAPLIAEILLADWRGESHAYGTMLRAGRFGPAPETSPA